MFDPASAIRRPDRVSDVRSSDEHVIKLVYSAREEDAAYKDPLYRYAAAKKVGLVD